MTKNVVNFTGMDYVYDACVEKESTPASKSVSDIVEAILNIGGSAQELLFYNPFYEVSRPLNVSIVRYFDNTFESVILYGVAPEEE